MEYIDDINQVNSENLQGFFVGWKVPLTPELHYKVLQGSTHFIIAMDSNKAIGFITALSDGVTSGFIPLLEVLPEYQKQGVGSELVKRMLIKLEDITNVDLTCDINVQPFYERFNMLHSSGMVLRKYLL